MAIDTALGAMFAGLANTVNDGFTAGKNKALLNRALFMLALSATQSQVRRLGLLGSVTQCIFLALPALSFPHQ